MIKKSLLLFSVSTCLLGFGMSPLQAAGLNSVANGFYNSSGFHNGVDDLADIPVGFSGGLANFFVFDLSSLAGQTVTSATLNIAAAGQYRGLDDSEVYQTWDYNGSIASLLDSQVADAAGLGIYTDLTSGTKYASTTINNPTPGFDGQDNDMPSVSVSLTLALGDINALLAGSDFLFAVGGDCLDCVNDLTTTEGLWGNIGSGNTSRAQLVLETSVVPLPAAAWLMGSALFGLVALKRKKA